MKNKGSYGHDNIANELIKCAKEELIEPLTLLVNPMLKSGHFPSELKLSKVNPLFKKGDPSEFIQLVDYITKQMDMGKVQTNVYIDLSKAFNTLDHSILHHKLIYYGIC